MSLDNFFTSISSDGFISNEVIVAPISKANEKSAISLIRVSGFSSLNFFGKFLSLRGPIEPRKCYLINIVDLISLEIIDQPLMVFFEGPNSFTGENVLELSLHGNPYIVERCLLTLVKVLKCRIALPGEFSYRAYRNGKLSLFQIESLDLLLNSVSMPLLSQAQKGLSGLISNDFIELKSLIEKHRTLIDIFTDFNEDIGDDFVRSELNHSLESLVSLSISLQNKCSIPLSHLVEPKICLFGRTNAGKSTLFNSLLNSERSIVSEIEGTTRDYVSETFSHSDVVFKIFDTAGLRDTEDVVERIGIKKAIQIAQSSFIKLLVIDGVASCKQIDIDFYKENNILIDAVVLTKQDLMVERVVPFNLNVPIFSVNARDPHSLNEIKDFFVSSYNNNFNNSPILVLRQRIVINEINDLLKDYLSQINNYEDVALCADLFLRVVRKSEELFGVFSVEDSLNSIFSNFCIGK